MAVLFLVDLQCMHGLLVSSIRPGMPMTILDHFPLCCLACHCMPGSMVDLTAGDPPIQMVAAAKTGVFMLDDNEDTK
jgi:hypothetical protein